MAFTWSSTAVKIATYNAGQNNLAKTSYCVFLSRKGDISELPPSLNFSVVLEVLVCECAMTSTLILGRGGRDNVREKENVQDSIKSSWIS